MEAYCPSDPALEVTQSHLHFILLVKAAKRPTQVQGLMTQPPSLDGGVSKFWNEHVGLKILLWPFWKIQSATKHLTDVEGHGDPR